MSVSVPCCPNVEVPNNLTLTYQPPGIGCNCAGNAGGVPASVNLVYAAKSNSWTGSLDIACPPNNPEAYKKLNFEPKCDGNSIPITWRLTLTGTGGTANAFCNGCS